MNLDSYLARISYSGPLAPTLENLRALHYAHLLAVPFENLDIHRGMPIALDQEHLYDKIVLHRRGGFCYELNSLFAADLGLTLAFRACKYGEPEADSAPVAGTP